MQTGTSGFLRSSYSKLVIKKERKLCKQVDKFNEQLITKDSKEYKEKNSNNTVESR